MSLTFSFFSIVHIFQLKMKIMISGTTKGLSTTSTKSLLKLLFLNKYIYIINITVKECILFNRKYFTEKTAWRRNCGYVLLS